MSKNKQPPTVRMAVKILSLLTEPLATNPTIVGNYSACIQQKAAIAEKYLCYLTKFQQIRTARRCADNAYYAAVAVRDTAASLAAYLNAWPSRQQRTAPSLRGLIENLADLAVHFGEYGKPKLESDCLLVSIGEVTLTDTNDDDHYLGRFSIKFKFDSSRISYRILSSGGTPSYDGFLHPHVQDHKLCEGSGAHLIATSMQTGNLFSAATLIAAGLRTYNPNSPYRALEDWHGGQECSSCGSRIGENDVSASCLVCDTLLCENCYHHCCFCENDFCGEHRPDTCADCGNTVCDNCSIRCDDCENIFCPDCVQKYDEDGQENSSGDYLCRECAETRQENADDDDETANETPDPNQLTLPLGQ